jgi:membrane-associated protein
MAYVKFLIYNVLGAALWVGLLLGAGYTLGGLEWVQRNFEKVVIGIVIVSVLPIVWEWWKARSTRRAAATDR